MQIDVNEPTALYALVNVIRERDETIKRHEAIFQELHEMVDALFVENKRLHALRWYQLFGWL